MNIPPIMALLWVVAATAGFFSLYLVLGLIERGIGIVRYSILRMPRVREIYITKHTERCMTCDARISTVERLSTPEEIQASEDLDRKFRK